MTTLIQPRVSSTILSEIPRFFGSNLQMFRELIQNACRAGAISLHITVSEDGLTLSFHDDGPGLSDPQLLLTVAESGWENPAITDPAGMGALSTLNPELVNHVEFASQDWAFDITPAEFAAGQSIQTREGSTRGMKVTLHLKKAIYQLDKELAHARARAPLQVYFNGQEIEPTALNGQPYELPEGTVYLRNQEYATSQGTYWEGFPNSSNLLTTINSLNPSHAVQSLCGMLAATFIPHHDSGVLPKLPDRNTMLENDAWRQAAHHLMQLLQTELDQLFAHIDFSQPVLNYDHALKDLQPSPLLPRHKRYSVFTAVLSDHGYMSEELFTRETYIQYADDSEYDETRELTILAIKSDCALMTTASSVASLLKQRQLGVNIPAVYSGGYNCQPDAEVVLGTVADPATHKKIHRSYTTVNIILCDHITFQGVPLTWHVEGKDLCLQGNPAEAERTLREQLEHIASVFTQNAETDRDLRDIMDIYEETTLLPATVGEWLLEQFILAYFPDRKAAYQKREQLQALCRSLTSLHTQREMLAPYPGLVQAIEEAYPDHERLQRNILQLTTDYNLTT